MSEGHTKPVAEVLDRFWPETSVNDADLRLLAACLQTVELRLSIVEKELRALQDKGIWKIGDKP